MKLIKISELAGKDVSGVKVDLRIRTFNGTFKYTFQRTEPEIIATLKNVDWEFHKIRTQDNKKAKWLYWRWETKGLNMPHNCGYGGTANPADWENDYLKIIN